MFTRLPRHLFLTLIILSSAAAAQDAATREMPRRMHVVRASGEATVTAKPDQAEISIAVVTQAPVAQTASEQNAAESSRVLEAVKRQVGSNGQVRTTGYSINPEYAYSEGHTPKVTAYTATNTILATITELSLAGKIIDAASGAGANRINGISFSVKNDESVRAEALTEATKKARSNAEAIARALNLRVIGVLEAESTQPATIRPVMMQAGAMAKMQTAAPTPIEPGNIDVHASVTVVLEVQ